MPQRWPTSSTASVGVTPKKSDIVLPATTDDGATEARFMLMIILPEYDANWHQKCTFFPLTLEDKTTDLDTVIFVLAVGNPIHYGVQVEFWSNLTIFRCDDPSKIDKFAIFQFFFNFFTFFAVFQD